MIYKVMEEIDDGVVNQKRDRDESAVTSESISEMMQFLIEDR